MSPWPSSRPCIESVTLIGILSIIKICIELSVCCGHKSLCFPANFVSAYCATAPRLELLKMATVVLKIQFCLHFQNDTVREIFCGAKRCLFYIIGDHMMEAWNMQSSYTPLILKKALAFTHDRFQYQKRVQNEAMSFRLSFPSL